MSQAVSASGEAVPNGPAAQPPATPDESLLVWVDMEMTGLRPEVDRVIEIALVITDNRLNPLVQSEAYAVHQPDVVLNAMDQWNTITHARSGLTQRVRVSGWNEASVEQTLLDFLARWVPAGERAASRRRCRWVIGWVIWLRRQDDGWRTADASVPVGAGAARLAAAAGTRAEDGVERSARCAHSAEGSSGGGGSRGSAWLEAECTICGGVRGEVLVLKAAG